MSIVLRLNHADIIIPRGPEATARGIIWNENSPVPGFVRGDIRDPFGNRIEFLQSVDSQ